MLFSKKKKSGTSSSSPLWKANANQIERPMHGKKHMRVEPWSTSTNVPGAEDVFGLGAIIPDLPQPVKRALDVLKEIYISISEKVQSLDRKRGLLLQGLQGF